MVIVRLELRLFDFENTWKDIGYQAWAMLINFHTMISGFLNLLHMNATVVSLANKIYLAAIWVLITFSMI
jgi:hypothetical protein